MRLLVRTLSVAAPEDAAGGGGAYDRGGGGFGDGAGTAGLVLYHPETGLPEPRLDAATPEAWLPGGNFLLTSVNERSGGWTGGTYWSVIIDRDGRSFCGMCLGGGDLI